MVKVIENRLGNFDQSGWQTEEHMRRTIDLIGVHDRTTDEGEMIYRIDMLKLSDLLSEFEEIKSIEYDTKAQTRISELEDENDVLKEKIEKLNNLNRVKSRKYEKMLISFIKKEGKATTSEIADHLQVKPGNASRIINRLILQSRLKKIRRGLYRLGVQE